VKYLLAACLFLPLAAAAIAAAETPPVAPPAAPRTTSQELTAAGVLDRMEARQKELIDLKAEMVQVTSTPGQPELETIKGQLVLKRPDKLYVEYREPVKQLLVSDGKKIWLYTPEMKQVIEKPVDPEGRDHLLFQLGQSLDFLRKNYDAVLGAETEKIEGRPCRALTLTPKKKDDLEAIRLRVWVDTENWLPVRTETEDPGGARVTVTLAKIKTDTGVENKFFGFKAPDGVEVIVAPLTPDEGGQ
jgi:outer membrane lipoprotein carrier protein